MYSLSNLAPPLLREGWGGESESHTAGIGAGWGGEVVKRTFMVHFW